MRLPCPKGQDIVDVALGDPGPISDISQFRASQDRFSNQQPFRGDIGYIGEPQIVTPYKKPKKQEFSLEQKEDNTKFVRKRIYVEHLIRKIKIFRVAQQRFRLRAGKYQLVMQVICGLVRLRIGVLILPIVTC
ncbi:transposase family protein [Oscillatoria sp. CS-180]|uniref:transposase family protein n=1 Tax=Oscillatoria sp. CS-180 TaxID=3021720 RepID=UPI00232D7C2A|nr:transposase family protein [Oscillatoria sp. CS-180]MDB9524748.1 transposase family protein [Oscillatoria sp. CS-180]